MPVRMVCGSNLFKVIQKMLQKPKGGFVTRYTVAIFLPKFLEEIEYLNEIGRPKDSSYYLYIRYLT